MDIGRGKSFKLGGLEVSTNDGCAASHLERTYPKNEIEQRQKGYEEETELW